MDRIYSLLGFAQRSGKLVSGEEGVASALRRGRVHCLIIATDSSQNTQQRYKAMAKARNVCWYLFGTKTELGQAIGKAQRSLIAVTDPSFARAIGLELSMQNLSGEKD